MKKFILASAVLLASVMLGGVLRADQFEMPDSNASQPAFIDYGGTYYSTGSFTVGFVTGSITSCVFQNVIFSSGINTDFVDVWDATAAVTTPTSPQFRFYNVANSTAGANSIAVGGSPGRSGFPIKLGRGMIWRPSNSSYNSIAVQFYRDADAKPR